MKYIIVILIYLIYAAGMTEEEKTPGGFMTKGIEYFQRKNYTMAQDMLENARSAHAENPVLWRYLGLTYFANKKYQKSIGAFKRAIELKPDDAASYLNLAESYTHDFDNENALKFYRRFLNMRKNIPDVHLDLGYLYAYRLKDRDKVVHHWETYLEMRPDAPQREPILAYLKQLKGLTGDALKKWKRNVEVDPRKRKQTVVIKDNRSNKSGGDNGKSDGGQGDSGKSDGGQGGTGITDNGKTQPSTPPRIGIRGSSGPGKKVDIEKKKPKVIIDTIDDDLDNLD